MELIQSVVLYFLSVLDIEWGLSWVESMGWWARLRKIFLDLGIYQVMAKVNDIMFYLIN